MAWSSISPLGTVSVKSNLTIIGGNTTYTEVTMGNNTVGGLQQDHYWNTGAPTEGRHRRINMNRFTSAQTPNGGMDSIYYTANIPDAAVNCARFNTQGIDWQLNAWENVNKGTFTTPNAFTYGLLLNIGSDTMGFIIIYSQALGFAMSGQYVTDNAAFCYGWSNPIVVDNLSQGTRDNPLILRNSPSAPGVLEVRVSSTFGTYRNKQFSYVNFTRRI